MHITATDRLDKYTNKIIHETKLGIKHKPNTTELRHKTEQFYITK